MGNKATRLTEVVFSEQWMESLESITTQLKVSPGQRAEEKTIRITGDQGADIFAGYFANNGAVTSLIIEGPSLPLGETTYMSKIGFQRLVECLWRDFTLVKLKFAGHEIDEVTGTIIAENLVQNEKVTELIFWNSKIEDKTALAMVKILANKPNLKVINLGENKLTEPCKSQLETIAKKYKFTIHLF